MFLVLALMILCLFALRTLRLKDLKFEDASSFVRSAAAVAPLDARTVGADAAGLQCGAAQASGLAAASGMLTHPTCSHTWMVPYVLFDNFLACTRRLPAARCDATHRKHAVRRLTPRSAIWHARRRTNARARFSARYGRAHVRTVVGRAGKSGRGLASELFEGASDEVSYARLSRSAQTDHFEVTVSASAVTHSSSVVKLV
ncbi:hypothetical protein EDB83DRAFT_2445924 [Lactarius deliciosus]|nr:hypothetical protein EDB83DRAFT_2445924 [Lactarius deliciosus]